MTLTIDDLKTEHSFQGTWITDKTIPYDRKKSPVPLCVRKTFTLKKKLRRAMLYATAVGSYYVTVNGEKITAEMLAPGYTSYAKYLQYQAYDVTEQLNAENENLYSQPKMPAGQGIFSPDKANFRRNTLCIARKFNAGWRKKTRPDGV